MRDRQSISSDPAGISDGDEAERRLSRNRKPFHLHPGSHFRLRLALPYSPGGATSSSRAAVGGPVTPPHHSAALVCLPSALDCLSALRARSHQLALPLHRAADLRGGPARDGARGRRGARKLKCVEGGLFPLRGASTAFGRRRRIRGASAVIARPRVARSRRGELAVGRCLEGFGLQPSARRRTEPLAQVPWWGKVRDPSPAAQGPELSCQPMLRGLMDDG